MNSDMLVGSRVVVFGGSSGIGLSTARFAFEHGAAVTIASRTQARLEAARTQLGNVEIVALDLIDPRCPALAPASYAPEVLRLVLAPQDSE